MRLTFMATVPFTVLLYVLAAPTVTLIYNAPKAELATQITAFSIFFLGVHQVTTGILQGLNKPRIPVINMGISLVIKVILVGHKPILFMAVHRADISKRNTMLGERIHLYCKAYHTERNALPELQQAG